MTAPLPALFLSHGAPTLAIADSPARRFLAAFGASLPRPRAILLASAHWLTQGPALSLADRPETIHDFGGFGPELAAMTYPAPGAPELADRAAHLLAEAGFTVALDPRRGLDHGAWVPLSLLYPAADVPVTSLSIQPREDAGHHLAIGAALRPLRDEGVLVVGSGALSHNLGEVFAHEPEDSKAPGWVRDFADWAAEAVAAGDRARLADWQAQAPHAARNHPTPEHLLPLFVAAGAGSEGRPGRVLHRSQTYGVLAMDSYAFD